MKGMGFILQDRGGLFALDPSHPNALAPRKRPFHTIIPAFMEQGDVHIGFGIMGGANQPLAHAQFVSNFVDYGMNIQPRSPSRASPSAIRRVNECTIVIESRLRVTCKTAGTKGTQLQCEEGIFGGDGTGPGRAAQLENRKTLRPRIPGPTARPSRSRFLCSSRIETMSQDQRDRELGMNRRITRRDFLNGAAVGIGVLGTAGFAETASGAEGTAPVAAPPAYPPALNGMRGSQPGAFDVAHALRDGTFWESAGSPVDTHEAYDLIVVGGGISGLSAAYFYRKQAGPEVPHSDSRQSRRLRRARQAQRVPGGQAAALK